MIINGVEILFFMSNDEYPWGTSLVTDYNFFSLGLILSLMFGYNLYIKAYSLILKIFYMSSIHIILLTIVLSGSRRGVITIVFMLFYFI
jgi:hypothetical protein